MTGTGVNDSGTFRRECSLKALTKAWNAKCNWADHVQRVSWEGKTDGFFEE
jgi:hypothetical protein